MKRWIALTLCITIILLGILTSLYGALEWDSPTSVTAGIISALLGLLILFVLAYKADTLQ